MPTTLSLTPEKPIFDFDEPVVLVYSHTLSEETGSYTGSASFASGDLSVSGSAVIRDRLNNYNAPVLSGYSFVVDSANPARWIGTRI